MLAENRKVKIKESKLLYQPKRTVMIWKPSNFGSQQKRLFHFVLAVSIDKQLFYEHEFKFTNLKFCKITNKINE